MAVSETARNKRKTVDRRLVAAGETAKRDKRRELRRRGEPRATRWKTGERSKQFREESRTKSLRFDFFLPKSFFYP